MFKKDSYWRQSILKFWNYYNSDSISTQIGLKSISDDLGFKFSREDIALQKEEYLWISSYINYFSGFWILSFCS